MLDAQKKKSIFIFNVDTLTANVEILLHVFMESYYSMPRI